MRKFRQVLSRSGMQKFKKRKKMVCQSGVPSSAREKACRECWLGGQRLRLAGQNASSASSRQRAGW